MSFEKLYEQRPDLRWKIEQLRAMEAGRDPVYHPFESAQEAAQPEPPALAPGMTSVRYAPPRAADPTSDVVVPVLQSIIAALAISGAVLAILIGVPWFNELQPEALTITLIICAIAFATVYIFLMRRHSDATTLVQIIEEVTRLDIDRDGAVGKPPVQPQEVTKAILVDRQPPPRMYDIPGFCKVPYNAMHQFLDYADTDGLTWEEAHRSGIVERGHWDAIIAYTTKLGLTTDKSQGRDAELIDGIDHDALMSRVFKGA